MPLKVLGIAVFLVGAAVWVVALGGLLLNAGDFWGLSPFSWSLFARAIAGLLVAVGGVILSRVGSSRVESTSLKI